jgi:hypothetical protein
VFFRFEDVHGAGELGDISVCGARIVDAEPRIKPGTQLLLLFAPFKDFLPIQVSAKVVRETENGFAVAFTNLEPRLFLWLQMAASKANCAQSDDQDETIPLVER